MGFHRPRGGVGPVGGAILRDPQGQPGLGGKNKNFFRQDHTDNTDFNVNHFNQ